MEYEKLETYLDFYVNFRLRCTVGQKIKKIQAQKTREIKLINFPKYFFDQIPLFAVSKMAKNQFLNWEKV